MRREHTREFEHLHAVRTKSHTRCGRRRERSGHCVRDASAAGVNQFTGRRYPASSESRRFRRHSRKANVHALFTGQDRTKNWLQSANVAYLFTLRSLVGQGVVVAVGNKRIYHNPITIETPKSPKDRGRTMRPTLRDRWLLS